MNSKFRVNTIISLVYITRCCVSLLQLQQNNLNNPEAHSEPCQTSLKKKKLYGPFYGWGSTASRLQPLRGRWIVDHLYLTLTNLLLAWMLYFYVWLQSKERILSLKWILKSVRYISNVPVYPFYDHNKAT